MNKALWIGLLLIPVASNAVSWIDLGKSNDKQMQTFLDYDSVKVQDIRVMKSSGFTSYADQPEYISAIIQQTYINSNPLRKKGVYYSKEQWFMSCDNQNYFVNAVISYGFKDEVINSWQSQKRGLSESDFSYAFPETVGGNIIEQACGSLILKRIDKSESYEDYINNYVN